jgi:flagellar protein FliS
VNPYNAYAQANVMTDEQDKGKVLLKVLNALPEKIELVKVLIRQKKYERKYEELSKIVAVLEILDASLDMSYGELPKKLSGFYAYLIKRLREVHTTLDIETLDRCKGMVSTLAEGFTEAYQLDKKARAKQPERPEKLSTIDSRA